LRRAGRSHTFGRMSARKPRSSFAAPLVVTLAVGPACVVTPTPTSSPQPQPVGSNVDRRTHGPNDGQGTTAPPIQPVVNPPRPDTATQTPPPAPPPATPPRQPSPGGDQVVQHPTPTPTQQPPARLRNWTVRFSNSDSKSCLAYVDVDCPPPSVATCNPPPPIKIDCPPHLGKAGAKIEEQSPDACLVVYPTPTCPPNVACNPPRPTKIDCPTR